ncbi:uncharacterized protein A4U43_C01F30880 [Asparagus officinalis]|uniref:Aminotransferase class I/classII large domain-containing protein n=1 Tax=Asparagus officinalis TaxID=4686 RepID=A0A5P1FX43_ASPOF|nr:uncharacterized protein A4U43_C01F30880 [Asparagus officinalis]
MEVKWRFQPSCSLAAAGDLNVRAVVKRLIENVDKNSGKPMINLGHGDPSGFSCFRTAETAEGALVSAVRSAKYNGYPVRGGTPSARSAIAEYLSKDLPYKLSPDDVYVTSGCNQAIEILLSVLALPGANILLPRACFPFYETRAAFSKLEVRHFNLVAERGWEVDLDNVEALADENTVAMVVINPGNPCGNVSTYQHLNKVVPYAILYH